MVRSRFSRSGRDSPKRTGYRDCRPRRGCTGCTPLHTGCKDCTLLRTDCRGSPLPLLPAPAHGLQGFSSSSTAGIAGIRRRARIAGVCRRTGITGICRRATRVETGLKRHRIRCQRGQLLRIPRECFRLHGHQHAELHHFLGRHLLHARHLSGHRDPVRIGLREGRIERPVAHVAGLAGESIGAQAGVVPELLSVGNQVVVHFRLHDVPARTLEIGSLDCGSTAGIAGVARARAGVARIAGVAGRTRVAGTACSIRVARIAGGAGIARGRARVAGVLGCAGVTRVLLLFLFHPARVAGVAGPGAGIAGIACRGLHGLQLAARSRSSPEDVAEAPTRTAHGFEEAECTVAPPPMAMRPPITAPYKGLRLNLGCCWSFIAHGLLCPPECLPVGLLFRLVLYFTKSCAAIRQQVSILVEFTEQGAYPYIQTIPGLSKLSPIAFRA